MFYFICLFWRRRTLLSGAFAFDDIRELDYYGCFRSDPATPALSKRAGARGEVHTGKGFASLQHCARQCDRWDYAFAGINGDGCFCGNDAPDAGGSASSTQTLNPKP